MIKVFEMFSGYGGATFALKKTNIEFECIGFSEIDKYAIQCYIQNHGNIKNYGDCSKINTSDLPDFDLLTGGFPCQDVSIAGKRDLSKGRTNLYKEILRIAKDKQPKYMLLENVAGLLSMGNERKLIDVIVSDLKKINYQVAYKLLNSKEFGIPQSRARVWIVCFRNDIFVPFKFSFPEPIPLKIFVKDILEKDVDSKYFLTQRLQERFAKYLTENETKIVGMRGRNSENPCARIAGLPTEQRIEARDDGCSNNLSTVQKDNLVLIPQTKCLGVIESTCNKRIHQVSQEINQFLKDNKKGYSINDIASALNEPESKVSHYFRTDNSRATPSPEIWLKLKNILSFSNKYDAQVTEVYEKEIKFEQTRRVYGTNGTAPTLNTIQEPIIFDSRNYQNETEPRQYTEGIAPTLMARARTDETPIISPTLTLELAHQHGRTFDAKMFHKLTGQLRRLTPRECFRLMGFFNDEINIANISDTQCYRLAGNGWCLRPATEILRNMLECFENGRK